MSLPKQIPHFDTMIGTVNKENGTVTISTGWYQFLMRQYLDTIGGGLGTVDSELSATANMEMLNNLAAHGYTGAATATFTATNKPGSNGSPVAWIPINVDGVIRYIACFS